MAYRKWTPAERQYVQDKWGEMDLSGIAKRLGRSVGSITNELQRQGSTAWKGTTDLVQIKQVAQVMGTDYNTVLDSWIPAGLPVKRKVAWRKRRMLFVAMGDLFEWLREHPDRWDSRRVEPYALGQEPDWLIEKRRQDVENAREHPSGRYSEMEDAVLRREFRRGTPTEEIGKMLNRPRGSVRRRIERLDMWGTGSMADTRRRRKQW